MVVLIPCFLCFYFYMSLTEVPFAIVIAVMIFQELIVLILCYLKITSATKPLKVQYIESRYGINTLENPKNEKKGVDNSVEMISVVENT